MNRMLRTVLLAVLVLSLSVPAAFAWECPGCQAENSANFCPYCGHSKPVENCNTCNTILEIGFSFCPNCGNSIVDTVAPASPTLLGFTLPLDEARTIVVDYLESAQNNGFTPPSTADGYPIWIDHDAMLALGNALLSSDPLPASAQGLWTIHLYNTMGNGITHHSGIVDELSSVQGRDFGTIQFDRDGVSYEFAYENGQIIYYSALISQNPNPADPLFIRYEGPYMEWNYLSSPYFANRDTIRVCMGITAQSADGNDLSYFIEYAANTGYIIR